ncbi:BlaI/MecI/CopY family transcriptional regulator [Polaribacter porphyrae]|uniref:Penicillinase repressor n=1 Tax=Polaribacter porphyrae TaxID=1137780 RepID=A0A2S7WMY8_9FLAO|nr:BlaI/MecI/CopY family transcriptional regulator [Polaribacter porphyrae]PQJ78682.1 penicillinase repressor [Polaribacter porphyrae]
MKQLNKSELQVMKYVWDLEKSFLKDIVFQFPEPKPAYTTISTLLNRMCEKKYIGFNKLGRDKEYYPLLDKRKYFSSQIKTIVSDFFNDSGSQFASFFAEETDLSQKELEEIQHLIEKQIKNKKQ